MSHPNSLFSPNATKMARLKWIIAAVAVVLGLGCYWALILSRPIGTSPEPNEVASQIGNLNSKSSGSKHGDSRPLGDDRPKKTKSKATLQKKEIVQYTDEQISQFRSLFSTEFSELKNWETGNVDVLLNNEKMTVLFVPPPPASLLDNMREKYLDHEGNSEGGTDLAASFENLLASLDVTRKGQAFQISVLVNAPKDGDTVFWNEVGNRSDLMISDDGDTITVRGRSKMLRANDPRIQDRFSHLFSIDH